MNILKEINEFRSSPRIQKELMDIGSLKEIKEGDIIVSDNAYIKHIPFVIKGLIKVIKTDEEGRDLVLYYLKSGESCALALLCSFNNSKSKIRAIAEEDSTILFIPTNKVPELAKEYPEWLEYIIRTYHERFEELLEVVNAVAFKKMDERLLDFLRKKDEFSTDHILHLTHEQIAQEMGTVRVVISRLLKQLEVEGKIKLGRNKIIVSDTI